MSDVTRIDITEAAHRKMGDARKDLDGLAREQDRVFRRYQKAQAELRDVGVQADALLSPPLEAAFGAWRQHGDRDTRLLPQVVGEAPVGDEQ